MTLDLVAIRERQNTLCDINVRFQGKERRHLSATLGILLVDDIPDLIAEIERLRCLLSHVRKTEIIPCSKCDETQGALGTRSDE